MFFSVYFLRNDNVLRANGKLDSSKDMELTTVKLLIHKNVNFKDNLFIFLKWLITYHHQRFAFSVLKSFVRINEGKHHFVEIHLTNSNQIDIPIDVFESNHPIVWNSICTETGIEKVWVFSGWKCQFCWMSSFHWFPSWWNYSYQRKTWWWIFYLLHNLLPFCLYFLQCQFIWTSKRTSPMAIEAWDQHLSKFYLHQTKNITYTLELKQISMRHKTVLQKF